MKKLKAILLINLILFCLLFINFCSNTIAGGTDTGNPTVTGKIVNETGEPASNAKVILRRKDFLKDTSFAHLKDIHFDSAETVTDNSGYFSFYSLDTGQYFIEASLGESLSVLLECDVQENDSTILIPEDTLAPTGKILGTVSLHGGPEAKRYAQIYGLDRAVETDAFGNFQFNVPEGEFKLRIVTGSLRYNKVDIPNIVPGDTPVSVKLLAENPISDDYICDTLIIRAILDSNGLGTLSVNAVISGMNSGRVSDLEIKETMFITIPSVIGGLHTVESIDMKKTLVSSLPGRIGELVNITELELDSNQLTTLPLEITNITQLVRLELSYNKLKNLLPAVKVWADTYDPDWADNQDTTVVKK